MPVRFKDFSEAKRDLDGESSNRLGDCLLNFAH